MVDLSRFEVKLRNYPGFQHQVVPQQPDVPQRIYRTDEAHMLVPQSSLSYHIFGHGAFPWQPSR